MNIRHSTMSSSDQNSFALHHKDKNITLQILQPTEEFWVCIRLLARIPLPPEEVYDILTSPDNHKIFRSIKKVKNRRVISDDGHGNSTVTIEQVGKWRFGPFSGSFSVPLRVSQSKHHGTIEFKLLPNATSKFMKDFSGRWKIQPFDSDSWEEMTVHPEKTHWGPVHNIRKAMHQFDALLGRHANSSLVELTQSVAPAMVPPPPIDKVLKSITAQQVKHIMEDLMNESQRRNNEQKSKEENNRKDRNGNDLEGPRGLESFIRQLKG